MLNKIAAKLLVIIAILMLFGIALLYYRIGKQEEALAYAAFGFAIIIFSIFYSKFLKPSHDKLSRDMFIEWIKQNKDILQISPVRYGPDLIKYFLNSHSSFWSLVSNTKNNWSLTPIFLMYDQNRIGSNIKFIWRSVRHDSSQRGYFQ